MTLCYRFLTSMLQRIKCMRSKNFNFMRNKVSKRCFNHQTNFYVSLSLNNVFFFFLTRRRGEGGLDQRIVSNNRKFWKIASPLFLETAFHKESLILNNNNKTINNNEELAEIFNDDFRKLVETLDTDKTLASSIASSDNTDPVFNAIKKYKYHLSIKNYIGGKDLKFLSIFATKNMILAEIHNLYNKKVCQEKDILVKIIKDNMDTFLNIFFITLTIRYLMQLSLQN